jgi:uncharacterized Fe-S cluster-containing radical SAM superfamily protein
MVNLPFNPLQIAEDTERIVMRGLSRKYHRFRPAPYYGGTATADQVGCCLLCAYCWNYERNLNAERAQGGYHTPDAVAKKLLDIARRKHYRKVRLSGAEPVLGQASLEHLCKIIETVTTEEPRLDFILETNGLLFGHQPEFARELKEFNRLQVRVCLKGWDEKSFESISGAEGRYYELPLRGLRTLLQNDVTAWPAAMYETFGAQGIDELGTKLREYGIKAQELEVEYLEPYPFVLANMKKRAVASYMHSSST